LENFELRYALHFTAVALTAFLSAACGTTRDAVTSTDTPSATAGSVLKTLQVAPSRVECTGVAPQLCLQVRESSDAAWTLLYEEIAGFEYEPGYLYEIRVKEEAVANPPADASAIRRTLVSILSKTAAPVALAGPTWRLVSLEGRAVLAGTRVTAVFGDDSRVSGSAGCNGYFGRAAVTDGQLAVGLLGATRMYCNADGLMAQEGAYLSALEKATAYRIVGGQLQLGPAPGVVTLVYETK
jgi:heat shock protein HslJ